MASSEGQAAACSRCGAALALAQGQQARCVYCLESQPLPSDIAAPLASAEALSAQLDEAKQAIARFGAARGKIWIILAVNIPGTLLAACMMAWAALSQDSALGIVMYAFIGIGGTAPVIAIPILWMRTQQKARDLQLASLPLSVPQVENASLSSRCPKCGAAHAPAGGLTVVCSSCRTEALLPVPLVQAKLLRRHQLVIDARVRGDAEKHAGTAAVTMWQQEVVPWIFAFSIFFGIMIFAFVVITEMTQP